MSQQAVQKRRLVLGELPKKEEEPSGRMYFRGPLGIWPWPLVNLLLALIETIRLRAPAPYKSRRFTVYEIVRDEKGRIVEIVEREVEEAR